MLAMPWPTSSTLGLCLVPLMRSETTADMSDSIAPSMATVIAGEISGRSKSKRNCGILIPGKPEGMPPKRVPIVSTGSFSKTTSAVPANSATMYPGTRFTKRIKIRITTRANTPRPVSKGENVRKFRARISIRARNSPGTLSTLRPKKSLICVLAMMTAMPFVNPTTTGRGIYFTAVPRPVMPRMTSITPAMSVHMNKPSRP